MKANELRIGNLLRDTISKTELKVIELTEKDIITYVIDRSKYPLKDGWELEPILLTEEWLLKFGFEEFFIDETWYFIKNDFVFDISGIIGFYNYNELEAICFNENKCKYVHQLQNLYFALTGEELTINQ